MAHVWIRLDSGNTTPIKKAYKDLTGRVINLVQETQKRIYVEIPEEEQGWLDKVCKDFNLNQIKQTSSPKYDKAPCGLLTIDVARHHLACTKCKIAEGRNVASVPKVIGPGTMNLNPYKPRNGKSRTILSVPGLSDFSLNGLLSLFKTRRDEAMDLADHYDKAAKALESLEETEKNLIKFQEEKKQHVQALNFFLEEKSKKGTP